MAEEAAGRQLTEDSQGEEGDEKQQQQGVEEEENRNTRVEGSEIDDFFASGGEQGGGRNGTQVDASHPGQDPVDSAVTSVELTSDMKVPEAANFAGSEEELGTEGHPLADDGGDRAQTRSRDSEVEEDDQRKTEEGAGDEHGETDGRNVANVDSSRDSKQETISDDHSEHSQDSGADHNTGDVKDEDSIEEEQAASSEESAPHTADRQSNDGEDSVLNQDDSENRAERVNSDVSLEDGVKNAGDCDSGETVSEAQETVQVIAQDLVQHVLDNAVRAEAETGEEDINRADVQSATGRQFPELDRVDLNSEDWSFDNHKKPGSVHDETQSNSDLQTNSKRDVVCSDQQPDASVDVRESGGADSQLFEGERELLGESQSLYQHAGELTPPAQLSPGSQVNSSHDWQQPTHMPSPKADYPLNYNNYKVCRMVSPGVKECLILETGEQVVYDCSRCGSATNAHHTSSSCSPVNQEAREKVKRSLFPEHSNDSGETNPAPNSTSECHSDPATNPAEKSTSQSHSPPPQHTQYSHPPEKSREVDESHDGSYLWLQRQVEWRAGSSKMPAMQSTRETARADWKEPGSRGTLHREERRGDSSRDLSGEDRLGSSMSGSADISGPKTSPGAIPNFNTLRDQQVSWLSMYRMLEEQHRTQLQAQYAEHQRAINDMQQHLEGELLNQQHNMRQKLDHHREALREQSMYSDYSKVKDSSGWSSKHAGHSQSLDETQFPRRSSLLELKEADGRQSYSKGSSRSGQGYSQRSQWNSQRPASEMSGEKRLRGGVYSSPMPLAKTRTSREVSGSEMDNRQHSPHSSATGRWLQDSQDDYSKTGVQSSSQQDIPSPRTQLSLREKHAKHMSDLRSYYEAEIQDLRQKLSIYAEGTHESLSGSTGRETARERILQQENQTLRQQARDLQDSLDDSHIRTRELEQKLQGLEIRAADYSDRYEESQRNVLKLKTRLEELHSYAKDRESMLEQAQSSERRQTSALQESYKAQEELQETARRDKSALKRLLDKYEMLEKDYIALKETSTELEQKLFDTRSEGVQLNKMMSQLELENKRLTHDNDNMRHRLAISGSLPITRQDYAENVQQRGQHEEQNGYSVDRPSVRNVTRRDTTPPRRVLSDEEDSDLGKSDSPLLRAERELRRLQQTLGRGEFVPRLQGKRYPSTESLGTDTGPVTIIDALSSSTKGMAVDAGSREGTKKGRAGGSASSVVKRDKPSGIQSRPSMSSKSPVRSGSYVNAQPTMVSSPTRFDIGISQTGSRSPAGQGSSSAGGQGAAGRKGKGREVPGERGGDAIRSPKPMSKAEENQSVDSTLKRLRSGEIVSRPQWEDVYTSLAKPTQPDKAATVNMTQEEMLRDRIRSIDQMERRYDSLQIEKRKLESQLNKVPTHGRDRKSRREKELLEEKLDSVDHELGSLRMTLKRYQVLKSTM